MDLFVRDSAGAGWHGRTNAAGDNVDTWELLGGL